MISLDKRILFYFLGGLALVGLAWFLLVPKSKEIWESREGLEQTRAKLERLNSKVKDLQGLDEVELSKRTKITLQAIPADKNYVEVLEILNKLANDQGLAVESFSVNPGPVSVEKKGELVFSIGLTGGNMEKVRTFLTEVKKMSPLMTPIEKLGIKISTKEATAEKAEISLTIQSYFQPLPKTLGTIDQPVPRLTANEEKFLSSLSVFNTFPQEVVPLPAGKANPFAF